MPVGTMVYMGVVSPFVSLADYLEMQSPAGMNDELIMGEVVLSPAPKPTHAVIAKRLLRLLDEVVDAAKFEVNVDMSVILNPSNPASMPRPDVFVMDRARFRAAIEQDCYPEGSPELAIEVVSPSNSKKELAAKVDLYLTHGSLAVWLVYPKRRTVALWEPGGKNSEFYSGEMLPLPPVLGGALIQVSDIFSALD